MTLTSILASAAASLTMMTATAPMLHEAIEGYVKTQKQIEVAICEAQYQRIPQTYRQQMQDECTAKRVGKIEDAFGPLLEHLAALDFAT
jgi:hypothetical protein